MEFEYQFEYQKVVRVVLGLREQNKIENTDAIEITYFIQISRQFRIHTSFKTFHNVMWQPLKNDILQKHCKLVNVVKMNLIKATYWSQTNITEAKDDS